MIKKKLITNIRKIFGMKWINFRNKRSVGTKKMAVVHIAAYPCLGKTSEASSTYFYLGAGINWLNDFKELLNGKLPCSVTSLQVLIRKAWSKETEFVYRLGRCTNMQKIGEKYFV